MINKSNRLEKMKICNQFLPNHRNHQLGQRKERKRVQNQVQKVFKPLQNYLFLQLVVMMRFFLLNLLHIQRRRLSLLLPMVNEVFVNKDN
jgi:hypothetical protein